MKEFAYLLDKKISLVISNNEKKGDVRVFLGELSFENAEYFFINRSKKWRLSISNDQLNSAVEVSSEIKDILLNADFFISLSIESLQDDPNNNLISTGLNWDE